MQMEELAVTTDGQYVHVVGDHITALPTILIKKAISRAEAFEKSNGVPHWPVQRPSPTVAAAPVVVIKRRRVAVPAKLKLPAAGSSIASEWFLPEFVPPVRVRR
jgi:hypothetical protein